MRIALRKAVTPLDLAKRVASTGRAGWLRQERISALFDGERVWSAPPSLASAAGGKNATAEEPLP
jgi:hypothetical protein